MNTRRGEGSTLSVSFCWRAGVAVPIGHCVLESRCRVHFDFVAVVRVPLGAFPLRCLGLSLLS